jgi:hypothetical protein
LYHQQKIAIGKLPRYPMLRFEETMRSLRLGKQRQKKKQYFRAQEFLSNRTLHNQL